MAARLLHAERREREGARRDASPSGGRARARAEILIARSRGGYRRELRSVGRKVDIHLRLPRPTASLVTASNPVCRGCGRAVADERAESLSLRPCLTMLKDGAWLLTGPRGARYLGLPASGIAARPSQGTAARDAAEVAANLPLRPARRRLHCRARRDSARIRGRDARRAPRRTCDG